MGVGVGAGVGMGIGVWGRGGGGSGARETGPVRLGPRRGPRCAGRTVSVLEARARLGVRVVVHDAAEVAPLALAPYLYKV